MKNREATRKLKTIQLDTIKENQNITMFTIDSALIKKETEKLVFVVEIKKNLFITRKENIIYVCK